MSIVAASLGVSVSKSERSRLSRHHQCWRKLVKQFAA
jgi:hypothetical protein